MKLQLPEVGESGSDILKQYNTLAASGALQDLEVLRRENRELDRIIQDAAILITHETIEDLLQFIISRMLDNYVPGFLAFVVEPPRGEELRQYCFRNLQPVPAAVPEAAYELIKQHFAQAASGLSFAELEHILGPAAFDREFRSLDPDLIFPMTGIGGLYGVVILGRKVIDDDYSPLEIMYIDRIIRFLSISFQNRLHHESAITDPKTGLFTYDFFVKRLEEEQAFARRHGSRSGVLIIDVDYFKHFNDSYGHLTGDLALEQLAAVLKSSTRREDCVARFGGEEFCILVADCSVRGLLEIAERIRRAVHAARLPYQDRELRITISLGARMVDGGEDTSPLSLLADADRALYIAKQNGRNRCILFSPGFFGRASMLRQATENLTAPAPKP